MKYTVHDGSQGWEIGITDSLTEAIKIGEANGISDYFITDGNGNEIDIDDVELPEMMTVNEKFSRLETLLKLRWPTYWEADEIKELRQGLKVSDFFKWLHEVKDETRCSPDYLRSIMGTDTQGWKGNTKLEAAIESGYVKRYSVRKYSRDIYYIELTRKGEALIK